MMVQAVASGAPAYGPQNASNNPSVTANSWQNRMQQALAPVAQLFGESASQLSTELQSGKSSLSALAQTKGVSQTDLVDAVKQGMQQGTSGGSAPLSDTQLTNIANRIANQVHGGHHHHHHGGGMSGPSDVGASTGGARMSATGGGNIDRNDTSPPGSSAIPASAVQTTTTASTTTAQALFTLQLAQASSASANLSFASAGSSTRSAYS